VFRKNPTDTCGVPIPIPSPPHPVSTRLFAQPRTRPANSPSMAPPKTVWNLTNSLGQHCSRPLILAYVHRSPPSTSSALAEATAPRPTILRRELNTWRSRHIGSTVPARLWTPWAVASALRGSLPWSKRRWKRAAFWCSAAAVSA
jgi:hypothetical protein